MAVHKLLPSVVAVWSMIKAVAADTCWYTYYDALSFRYRYKSKYCDSCCGTYGTEYCCPSSSISSSTTIIIGAVVGGIFFLAMVIGLVIYALTHKKLITFGNRRIVKRTTVQPATQTTVTTTPGIVEPPPYSGPPPAYTDPSYPAVYPVTQNANPANPPEPVLPYPVPQTNTYPPV